MGAIGGFYLGVAFVAGHDAVNIRMGKECGAESFARKAIVIG